MSLWQGRVTSPAVMVTSHRLPRAMKACSRVLERIVMAMAYLNTAKCILVVLLVIELFILDAASQR